VGGSSKIPSILYYDQQGNVRAVGDEANGEGIEQIAEDKEWTRTEWYVHRPLLYSVETTHLVTRFKLHLRPKTQSTSHITDTIIPLPEGKTAIDVFADFLRYLYQCAQKYIEETHFHGIHLWESLRPTSEFVLTHPNGWEGAQQGLMRRAAVKAGLIPDSAAGQARLSFVTEGEASLHFCIQNGLNNEAIQVRNLSAHFLVSQISCSY
jgi:molecular chaperone DnaK (HSP70)